MRTRGGIGHDNISFKRRLWKIVRLESDTTGLEKPIKFILGKTKRYKERGDFN